MQYKITRQTAKDIETFFAEFADLENAQLFIEAKTKQDDQLRMHKLYRLYDDGSLKKEFNPSQLKIDFDLAVFAEEEKDLSNMQARPYKVQQTTTIAQFIDVNDAKLFLEKKLATDATQKKEITYRLFNEGQLIEDVNQNKHPGKDEEGRRSSTTPFATAPKPPGTISTAGDDD